MVLPKRLTRATLIPEPVQVRKSELALEVFDVVSHVEDKAPVINSNVLHAPSSWRTGCLQRAGLAAVPSLLGHDRLGGPVGRVQRADVGGLYSGWTATATSLRAASSLCGASTLAAMTAAMIGPPVTLLSISTLSAARFTSSSLAVMETSIPA